MKVYCGECSHFCSDESANYCESPNNWTLESNFLQQFRQYKQKPEEKNAHNDCSDFKWVWYKRLFKRRDGATQNEYGLRAAS